MSRQVAVWVEPGDGDRPIYHRVDKADAVAEQRLVGRRRGYEYPTDEEAWVDYLTTTWAWVELCDDKAERDLVLGPLRPEPPEDVE